MIRVNFMIKGFTVLQREESTSPSDLSLSLCKCFSDLQSGKRAEQRLGCPSAQGGSVSWLLPHSGLLAAQFQKAALSAKASAGPVWRATQHSKPDFGLMPCTALDGRSSWSGGQTKS